MESISLRFGGNNKPERTKASLRPEPVTYYVEKLGTRDIQTTRLNTESSEDARRTIVLEQKQFMFDDVDYEYVLSQEPENDFNMHYTGKHIWTGTIISSANLWTLTFLQPSGHISLASLNYESQSWLVVGVEVLLKGLGGIFGVRLTLQNYRPYKKTKYNYYKGADYTNKYEMINRNRKKEIIVDVISSNTNPNGNAVAEWFKTTVGNQNIQGAWHGERYGTEFKQIVNPNYTKEKRKQIHLHDRS